MAEYTHTINENRLFISVKKSETEVIAFVVDANDPEPVTDRNGNLIGYTTYPEHKIMFTRLTTEEGELDRFANLLLENPTTAYQTYINT